MTLRIGLTTKLLAMVCLPVLATLALWGSAHFTQTRTNRFHATAMLWAEDAQAAQRESLTATRYLAEVSRLVYSDEILSGDQARALATQVIAAGKSSDALAGAFGPEEIEEERRIREKLVQLMEVGSRAVELVDGGRREEARQLFARRARPLREALLVELERRVEEETEGSHRWRQRATDAASSQSRLGLAVALCSMLILLPSFAFASHVHRGLEKLGAGARGIAAQDFSSRVAIEGNDELAELAAGFNQMAASLKRLRDEELSSAAAQARVQALEESRAQLEKLVSERTAANAELQRHLVALRDTDARLQTSERLAAIGTMAAGIAHEINNPLGYLASSLAFAMEELAAEPPPPGDFDARHQEVIQALKEAKEGADRVGAIVRDMKILSRPDGEEPPVAINLQECLSSACTIAGGALKKHSRLVKQLGDCPPVLATSGKLGQVFLNLLVNAGQAIPPGGDGGVVTVVTRTGSGGEAIVEVSDNGVGIPENVGGRIFDAFFTTKPPGVGTGLGLSICHTIITKLNGKIGFESQPGKGTTFRVTLPAAPGQQGPTRFQTSEVSRPWRPSQRGAPDVQGAASNEGGRL